MTKIRANRMDPTDQEKNVLLKSKLEDEEINQPAVSFNVSDQNEERERAEFCIFCFNCHYCFYCHYSLKRPNCYYCHNY